MDVNGTKFHLLHGRADWERLYLPGDPRTLAELWQLPEAQQPDIEWNQVEGSLHLARQPQLFRRAERIEPLDTALRRGAGRDRYGHWYWIDPNESGIRFLANGERQSALFWSSAVESAACLPDPEGGFVACPPALPERRLLRGLAVTQRRVAVEGETVDTGHYLVVGNVTQHGLLIFDLHRGGPPTLMTWPADVPFAPYDIAATPDGGVLILDRDNRCYWRLSSDFRLLGHVSEEAPDFLAAQEGGASGAPAVTTLVTGFPLDPPGETGTRAPIAIETGPDGRALILFTAADAAVPSFIYEYEAEALREAYSLQDVVDVYDPVDQISRPFSLNAHDLAYTACGGDEGCDCVDLTAVRAPSPAGRGLGRGAGLPGATTHIVYVAERDGNQVVAFELVRATPAVPARLEYQPEYLPLRRWEAKGIVASCGRVYYDFQDRWLPLQVFTECYYAARATIETGTTFAPASPGQPFDGEELGCVWHRLIFDAEIPNGTSLTIRARAADDPTLLDDSLWLDQPRPYQRGDGAELPYYDAIADRRANVLSADRAGTWELLFQGVVGRYVQLELTLEGTGRSTPALYALRAWYPRFSYLQYLPAVYRRDAVWSGFLERWLANFEGTYTSLEEKIAQFAMLLDPRIAPADTLEWLAGWLTIVFEPVWSERRRRFFIRHTHRLYQWRGTLPGLEMALRIYLDDEDQLDDTLFSLDCLGRGRIRIVEHYLMRDTGGLLFGDTAAPNTRLSPEQAAHRFTILLPHDFEDQERFDPVELENQWRMVERIVDMERPAHAEPVLKRYWAMFRVGEARLGLDTQLGHSSRIRPIVLGDSFLPEGHLALPYPFDLIDRLVMGRDRLGDLPVL